VVEAYLTALRAPMVPGRSRANLEEYTHAFAAWLSRNYDWVGRDERVDDELREQSRTARSSKTRAPRGRSRMAPSVSVVKTLFALSGNTCAFTGCETKLTAPGWRRVNADVAHICGENPGAARFDPAMSDAERNGFDNLILVCPNHHRLIVDLEPEAHTVEMLREMKQRHESTWRVPWASESALFDFAMLVIRPPTIDAPEQVHPPTVSPSGVPRLVAELDSDDRVHVVNTGDADAYGVTLEVHGQAWVPRGSAPSRLSPGGRWWAGSLALTMADTGPYTLRLTWRDESGRAFDGEFPLG
jgi:hypothetical protein